MFYELHHILYICSIPVVIGGLAVIGETITRHRKQRGRNGKVSTIRLS